LAEQGLPIHIRRHDKIGKHQAACVTSLMREAVLHFQADWVFLLDADEFIVGPDVRSTLAAGDQKPLEVQWRTYCPSASDRENEVNPVVRIGHCRLIEPETSWKVVVPAVLAADDSISACQGNHFLVRDGQVVKGCRIDAIRLAHFPVRSAEQYAAKTILSAMQYAAMGLARDVTWGTRSRRELDRFLADPEAFFANWRQAALTFALPSTVANPELTFDPLSYRGGPLRLIGESTDPNNLWRGIVQHAMVLATAYGLISDRSSVEEVQETSIIQEWSRRLAQREEAYQTALRTIQKLQAHLEELQSVRPATASWSFRWPWGSRSAA
jgi:hypothetical protein